MVLYERLGRDIDQGLTGFWKLDDKKSGGSVAIDRASFKDSTITGTIDATGINGLSPNALLFDGLDDFINVGDESIFDFGTNDFTISLWASTSQDTGGHLVTKRAGTNNTVGFNMGKNGADFFFIEIDDGAGNEVNLSGTVNVIDSEFHHVLVKKEGNTLYVYTDNADEQTADVSSVGTISNAIDLNLGRHSNISRYFDGIIQNIRIYNRGLSRGEISKLFRLRL